MDAEHDVIVLRRMYAHHWRNKSDWYWAFALCEEVIELLGALIGIHAGPVEWELKQIAAICINWLELRMSRMVSLEEQYWERGALAAKDDLFGIRTTIDAPGQLRVWYERGYAHEVYEASDE